MPMYENDIFSKLPSLIKLEKEEDLKQYQHKLSLNSLEDRKKAGITWYPIHLAKHTFTSGNNISLSLVKTKLDQFKHQFQVGSVVSLFKNTDKNKLTCSAVVAFVRREEIRIVIQKEEIPDWISEGKLGLDLLFDEFTYKEMEKAVAEVANAKTGHVARIRDIIYKGAQPEFSKGHQYSIPDLNDSQNDALNLMLQAKDIAVVHGPPGTGKTTTLVHGIKAIVAFEKQVLVCAPSNAAVDLLVERLIKQGVNTLRLGHPARLNNEVIDNSLDVKITKHQRYKDLKENRKKAEELRKIAYQYKRNFGKEERQQRERLKKESKFIKKYSREIEQNIIDDLLDDAQVIACTVTGANQLFLKDKVFKTVFIDECSQALEPACWIPILKAQRVIMAGDHCQLPPTIKSIIAAKEGLEISLFEKAIKLSSAVKMLTLQYRMHPQILGFSSEYFYKNKLETAASVLSRPTNSNVAFIDTAGCGFEEKTDPNSLSTYNEGEANLLYDYLKKNLLHSEDHIGIIAPYKAQINLLESIIDNDDDFKDGLSDGRSISINTVDSFQGQERDSIFISLVRSNDKLEIGFLKEYRRMNVAMTRAKNRLIVIGDSSTLGADDFFSQMIAYFDKNGFYHSAFEYL